MTIVTSPRRVVIGIDTHLDTIHLGAITDTGQLLGDAESPPPRPATGPRSVGPAVSATW
ncbi:hypothetical protein [Mycolicibacterium pulveris]|uniref:hypothetical protein n=1 Tax=Mycolicibacterium pulveris TaxID=36813 RepID=UPI001F1E8906|nr:hypothetical protein [Mycolicibacterium pulveris]